MDHCLNFKLTECTAVCNATSPASITNCQEAVQQLCEATTRPRGVRLLEEAREARAASSEPMHRGLADADGEAGPMELRHRGLVDNTCVNSPSFLAAIASGAPLTLVSGYEWA